MKLKATNFTFMGLSVQLAPKVLFSKTILWAEFSFNKNGNEYHWPQNDISETNLWRQLSNSLKSDLLVLLPKLGEFLCRWILAAGYLQCDFHTSVPDVVIVLHTTCAKQFRRLSYMLLILRTAYMIGQIGKLHVFFKRIITKYRHNIIHRQIYRLYIDALFCNFEVNSGSRSIYINYTTVQRTNKHIVPIGTHQLEGTTQLHWWYHWQRSRPPVCRAGRGA